MSWIKSFGRSRGKNFAQEKLDGLESYLITPEFLKTLKSEYEIILEIGFGYGENLISQSINSAEKIFLGAEVYLNGMIRILGQMKEREIKNIFLWKKDARDLLNIIPDFLLAKIFLLFPDPWPKARHHKRRIFSVQFLKLAATKLNEHGELVVATDHTEYSTWMKDITEKSNIFKIEKLQQNKLPFITTRYQQKAENREIHSYILTKNA